MLTQEIIIKSGFLAKIRITDMIKEDAKKLGIVYQIKEEPAGFLMSRLRIKLIGQNEKVEALTRKVQGFF